MDSIFDALKKNEKPVCFMKKELREAMLSMDRRLFKILQSTSSQTEARFCQHGKTASKSWGKVHGSCVYQLDSRYEDKPEIVMCERKGMSYKRTFKDGSTKVYDLFECLECNSFVGFRFDSGIVLPFTRLYRDANGTHTFELSMEKLQKGEYEVENHTHVVFEEQSNG